MRNLVIIGRPNIGKSSLFNALLGKRIAVVHDMPGVTRDRLSKKLQIDGTMFNLIDTGGYENNDIRYAEHINTQIDIAIKEADLILFLVDAKYGINPIDTDIANKLRGLEEKIFLLANKVDNHKVPYDEFIKLGLGEAIPISVVHRQGLTSLKSKVSTFFKAFGDEREIDLINPIKVALAGRPNTGKSTLLNSILGEERVVTSSLAGTTRDVVDVEITNQYGKFLLLDTAGIRRNAKIESNIEYYSIERTKKALTKTDVALLVVDGSEGITKQDKTVGSIIAESGVACVVLINKLDLMESELLKKEFLWKMPHLSYANFIHISALRDDNFDEIFKQIQLAYRERTKKIPTTKLNNFLHDMLEAHTPPMVSTKSIKLKYMVQVGINYAGTPKFVVFANYPKEVPTAYKRYLINGLRDYFGFHANPIKLIFREST